MLVQPKNIFKQRKTSKLSNWFCHNPKAPTPLLKRRPLAERSNLPPSSLLPPTSEASTASKSKSKPVTKSPSSSENPDEAGGGCNIKGKTANDDGRSRKERFLFWKNSKKSKKTSLFFEIG